MCDKMEEMIPSNCSMFNNIKADREKMWDVGEKLVNMGQRASDTRPIFFEDVVVPKANVLGHTVRRQPKQ